MRAGWRCRWQVVIPAIYSLYLIVKLILMCCFIATLNASEGGSFNFIEQSPMWKVRCWFCIITQAICSGGSIARFQYDGFASRLDTAAVELPCSGLYGSVVLLPLLYDHLILSRTIWYAYSWLVKDNCLLYAEVILWYEMADQQVRKLVFESVELFRYWILWSHV